MQRLEVSGAVGPMYGSLSVKLLKQVLQIAGRNVRVSEAVLTQNIAGKSNLCCNLNYLFFFPFKGL